MCLRTLDTNPVCAKSVRENGKTQKNKRKPMKINLRLFYMFDSCGLDSALRDSANRTLTCAGTAVNAFSSDYVCHDINPPLKFLFLILAQKDKIDKYQMGYKTEI